MSPAAPDTETFYELPPLDRSGVLFGFGFGEMVVLGVISLACFGLIQAKVPFWVYSPLMIGALVAVRRPWPGGLQLLEYRPVLAQRAPPAADRRSLAGQPPLDRHQGGPASLVDRPRAGHDPTDRARRGRDRRRCLGGSGHVRDRARLVELPAGAPGRTGGPVGPVGSGDRGVGGGRADRGPPRVVHADLQPGIAPGSPPVHRAGSRSGGSHPDSRRVHAAHPPGCRSHHQPPPVVQRHGGSAPPGRAPPDGASTRTASPGWRAPRRVGTSTIGR